MRASHSLQGELRVPGDKSLSHRALILSSFGPGKTLVQGLLESADVQATQSCLSQLGLTFSEPSANGEIVVQGVQGFVEPSKLLNVENSGTTIRLLSGLLAPQPFYAVLTGDESILKRPMGRVIQPLRQMGAPIFGRNQDTLAPLTLLPCSTPLRGLDYTMPVASAQVKSAILLAGLFAQGETRIHEPVASRDHTEQMLKQMGICHLETDGQTVCLLPNPDALWTASNNTRVWDIPGDFSSAAFWIVAGLLTPNANITIHGVNLNPKRTGVLDILDQYGIQLSISNPALRCGEPSGSLLITGQPDLVGNSQIDEGLVPSLVDEIPILSLLGLFAKGTMTVQGAAELRKKESDRIETLARGFSMLGISIETQPDGFIVEGNPDRILTAPKTPLPTHGDHRLAMTWTLLNQIALSRGNIQDSSPWSIESPECVRVSYPTFYQHLKQLCEPSAKVWV